MLGMDKRLAKTLFAEAGVKVPDGFTATRDCANEALAAEYLKKYGKLTVKPNGGGSTVGLSFITDAADYAKALEAVWQLEDLALVEQYIPGEEATVAVWEREDGTVEALPRGAYQAEERIFTTNKNKYTHGCTEYICPADFSPGR